MVASAAELRHSAGTAPGNGAHKITVNGVKVQRSVRKTQGGSALQKMLRFARAQWFILCVFASIGLAKMAPWVGVKGGPLKPEFTVKILGVGAIFFMSGLSLKTEELAKAAMQVNLHATIQGFSLAVTPLLVCTVAGFLESLITTAPGGGGSSGMEDVLSLLMGIKVLSCLPPPVSTGLILTKETEGNEAAAIFNGTIGAFMGVIFTPMLVMAVTGGSADVPIANIIKKLCITVVAPLLAGQLTKYSGIFSSKFLKKIPFSTMRSLILLTIIYTTFCGTFMKKLEITMGYFFGLVAVLLFQQCSNMFLVKNICAAQGMKRTDAVAAMFCAVHKSLTLGMPITGIVFEGDPKLAVITIPLLVYHPMQILLGSLLVPTLKKWVAAGQDEDPSRKG
uniref:Sodium/bile acid cotransporter n=1 Tax=Lotharella globosa TaxID=91324 RepID=A0A7S3YZI6_9EUKA